MGIYDRDYMRDLPGYRRIYGAERRVVSRVSVAQHKSVRTERPMWHYFAAIVLVRAGAVAATLLVAATIAFLR